MICWILSPIETLKLGDLSLGIEDKMKISSAQPIAGPW
jgi:hypothetical protein